jgi:hypothetical protein
MVMVVPVPMSMIVRMVVAVVVAVIAIVMLVIVMRMAVAMGVVILVARMIILRQVFTGMLLFGLTVLMFVVHNLIPALHMNICSYIV